MTSEFETTGSHELLHDEEPTATPTDRPTGDLRTASGSDVDDVTQTVTPSTPLPLRLYGL